MVVVFGRPHPFNDAQIDHWTVNVGSATDYRQQQYKKHGILNKNQLVQNSCGSADELRVGAFAIRLPIACACRNAAVFL